LTKEITRILGHTHAESQCGGVDTGRLAGILIFQVSVVAKSYCAFQSGLADLKRSSHVFSRHHEKFVGP
jgi:hypothetical protein